MKFLRGDNAGDMKKIYKSSIQRLLFFFLSNKSENEDIQSKENEKSKYKNENIINSR